MANELEDKTGIRERIEQENQDRSRFKNKFKGFIHTYANEIAAGIAVLTLAGLVALDYRDKNLENAANLGADAQKQEVYSEEQDEFPLGDREALKGLIYHNGSWDSPTNELEIMLKKIKPIKQEPIKYTPKKADSTNPITPDFIEKIVNQESNYNFRAVSKKGARGLMQITKPTWYEMTKKLYGEKLSYEESFNPVLNREVGTNYLFEIHEMLTNSLSRYANLSKGEKQKQIAAAYNGGIGRLLENDGDIQKMPRETRNYVKIVTKN